MKRLARRKKKKEQKKNGNKDKIFKTIIFATAILKFINEIKKLMS